MADGMLDAFDTVDVEAAAENAPAGTSSAVAAVRAIRSFDRMISPLRWDLPPWFSAIRYLPSASFYLCPAAGGRASARAAKEWSRTLSEEKSKESRPASGR